MDNLRQIIGWTMAIGLTAFALIRFSLPTEYSRWATAYRIVKYGMVSGEYRYQLEQKFGIFGWVVMTETVGTDIWAVLSYNSKEDAKAKLKELKRKRK